MYDSGLTDEVIAVEFLARGSGVFTADALAKWMRQRGIGHRSAVAVAGEVNRLQAESAGISRHRNRLPGSGRSVRALLLTTPLPCSGATSWHRPVRSRICQSPNPASTGQNSACPRAPSTTFPVAKNKREIHMTNRSPLAAAYRELRRSQSGSMIYDEPAQRPRQSGSTTTPAEELGRPR